MGEISSRFSQKPSPSYQKLAMQTHNKYLATYIYLFCVCLGYLLNVTFTFGRAELKRDCCRQWWCL